MTVRILQGDVLDKLAELPDESVQCCVTSPPYYGLRDYGTASWEGGDPGCDHSSGPLASNKSTLQGYTGEHVKLATGRMPHKDKCSKCGAIRKDAGIGLEATPEAHIARLVEVFREVKRVLRKDGVLWLNYGDAYAHDRLASKMNGDYSGDDGLYQRRADYIGGEMPKRLQGNIKPKDLLMMPARVALALQRDGWWLRSMIPWLKRSAMPESATDRPATAVEYVFMLTKSARYFFDMEAVRQKAIWAEDPRAGNGRHTYDGKRQGKAGTGQEAFVSINPAGRNFRNSDLFYASLEPPHGLISDADGAPLALDVNPAGFKSVAVYGKYRIGSPDCPIHGCQEYLERALRCGELQVAPDLPRNPGTRGYPAQGLEGVAYSILPDPGDVLEDWLFAIDHSNQIRKTAFELGQDGFSCGRLADRSECKGPHDHSAAKFCHIHDYNISADCASCAKAIDLLEQRPCHILGIATFKNSPDGCSCQYIGKVEKRLDHFASFPPKLIEPLIKAATSEKGCCPACAAPWVRGVERTISNRVSGGRGLNADRNDGGMACNADRTTKTLAWSPSCDCRAEASAEAGVPCVVLDPFGGAGTTGLVADRLGRDCILIELNPNYAEMARKRIAGDAPLFAEVQA